MRTACIVPLLASALFAQGKPVVVDKVVSKKIAAGRSFVASIEPARRVMMGSEIGGLVVEFAARPGLRVAKGDVLAKLRTRHLEDRLEAARAALEQEAQALLELKNGSRPEEKEEAAARVAQAEAAVEFRAWKLENARGLQKSGSVTEDELKEAALALATAKAKLREETAKWRLVVEGPRKERIAVAAARHKAQAAVVARMEDELARHSIRAPFAGYVVAEHTEKGAWLKQGDPVATIVELDEVDVVVPVLEDFVGGVRLGLKVDVRVDALPGEVISGAVTRIVPQADPRARTFPVKIRIKNRQRGGTVLLKAGMFARVSLAVGEKVDALLVPKDAVVLGGPAAIVYVVGSDNKVRPVPVRLGIAVEDLVAVQADLKPGDVVVVRGNERLRPGDLVKARPK